MSPVNPVKVNGLVFAVTHPVEAAVGAGDPQGKANTCHCVAGPAAFHVILAEDESTAEDVIENGAGQAGGNAQVTLATHPAALVVALLLNRNVKHPSTLEDVNEPGLVVPQ